MDLKKKINELTGLEYKYCDKPLKGGDILEPTGELFKDVVCLDFKSFYPSIIISLELFGHKMNEFLKEQMKLKNLGDKDAKLIMNSIYGYFKHYDYEKACIVTKLGRETIRNLREYLKEQNFDIIYSHTDSVMVSDIKDKDNLMSFVDVFVKSQFLNLTLNIENEFKFIYFQKIGDNFAKNRYVGVDYNDRLHLKGITLNEEEIKMIDFIQYTLSKGSNICNTKELQQYLEKYYKSNEKKQRFINLELLNIIDMESHKVNF